MHCLNYKTKLRLQVPVTLNELRYVDVVTKNSTVKEISDHNGNHMVKQKVIKYK